MDKERKIELTKNIISFIGAAGTVSFLVLFPGLAKLIGPMTRTRQSRHVGLVNQALKRLERGGIITINAHGANKFVTLTPKGWMMMNKIEIGKLKMRIPKQWDEKWRIVIFDVKEKNKTMRDRLRKTLSGLGFKRLQHSVWVYPYPCDDTVELIRQSYNLGRNVLYFTSGRFPGDYPLVRLFGFHNVKD